VGLERRQPSQDIGPVISDCDVRNVGVNYVETISVAQEAGGIERIVIMSRAARAMWEPSSKTTILGHFLLFALRNVVEGL